MKPSDIHQYVQYDAQERHFIVHDAVARNVLRLARSFAVEVREAEGEAVIVPAFAGRDDDLEGVRLIAEAIAEEIAPLIIVSEGTMQTSDIFHNAAAVAEEIGVPCKSTDLLVEEFLSKEKARKSGDEDAAVVMEEILGDLLATIEDYVRENYEGYTLESHADQPDLIGVFPDRDWIVDTLVEMRGAERE